MQKNTLHSKVKDLGKRYKEWKRQPGKLLKRLKLDKIPYEIKFGYIFVEEKTRSFVIPTLRQYVYRNHLDLWKAGANREAAMLYRKELKAKLAPAPKKVVDIPREGETRVYVVVRYHGWKVKA